MADVVTAPGLAVSAMTGSIGDGATPGGGVVPQSPPFGSRQGSSYVIWQADGSPYRSSSRNAQKGDDKTYTDIHNLNPYAQVLYTYEASHGYRDNSYLIFFPREEWYQERQKYSLRSVAAFRSVVDAMVQPVFEKQNLRTTNNPLFQTFIDNCDNTGTTLQDMNESAQTHARMLGVTFIVMDNFPDAGAVKTVQEAVDQRKFPYIYEKMPHEVHRWETNNWGKLNWISFFERQEQIEDPIHKGQYIIRQYYRKWDNKEWKIYYEQHKENKYNEFEEIVTERANHGLNYIPIYPVLDYVKNNNLKTLPTPKLADLANMAFVLYNMESWIELLCVYCFPTLTIPPMEGQQIAMSVNNAIEVPNDAKHAPAFIAPPTDCLDVLLKAADRLEDKIYKAANQLGVSGTRAKTTAAVSGVSKEWDFQASNALLTKTALSAGKLEAWCAKTFQDYTHTTFDYEVDFGTEFIEAYSNQRLEQAVGLLQEMPPDVGKKELWKEIFFVFFSDDAEKAQEICDQIDRDYAQNIKDQSVLGGGTGEGQPGNGGNPPGEGEKVGSAPGAKGMPVENDFIKTIQGFVGSLGKGNS